MNSMLPIFSSWLFLAISSYGIFSITNFIDKFLIEKLIKNPIGIVILDGFLYVILGIIIFIFAGSHFLPLNQSLILIVAGTFLTFYLIPYFKALQLDDTSRVVPLFQFYPLFTLILAFIFLHETLSIKELLGFIFIIIGGFILGSEHLSKKIFKLRKSFFLMILSSLLYAFTNIMFKFINSNNFWVNFSYLTFGSAIGCFLLLYKNENRKILLNQVKILSLKTYVILLVNALLNLLAELLTFLAISLGPVALVSAVNGIQPFIVLVYGLILTLFFPKIIKEDIKRNTLIIKLFSAVILFIGIYFISV